MNVKKNLLTQNDCYKKGKKITPVGMQLHTIGTAQNTAASLASYWNQSGVEACVHYCVDAETPDTVLQFLPDTYYSWADGGFGNRNLITVELMESDSMKYTYGATYTVTNEANFKADVTRAYNTAVKFFASKCKEYGWNPTDKLPNGLYVVSSHDEGRRAGLSTAHVDPTHIWNRMGWTMDKFRADVKEAMGGASVPSTGTLQYYVRRSWNDSKSQLGAFSILDNATKLCDVSPGYKVYDTSGKVVYENKIDESKCDKIWMGWTKRETGKDGLRNIHGDSGRAYGLQFDYRYGLLDFLQYCVDHNAERYGAFKKFIAYGKGSSKLVYNTELGSLWQQFYDNYTAEFENLQYSCAYKKYYLPAKEYVRKNYGINMDNHSPAVKGTLWSMSFRSGQESGAKKFSGCNDSTPDETMLNKAYSTYGTADANRWTKNGQWGDALNALKNNEYTLLYVDNAASGTTPSVKVTPYRVGTAWSKGKCVNQHGAFDVLDNAKKDADIAKNTLHTTYYVFDATGKEVYKSTYIAPKSSGILPQCEKFQAQLKKDIANGKRWEYHNPSRFLEEQWSNALAKNKRACNCALLARWALKEAGLIPQNTSIFYGKKGGTIKWGKGSKEAVAKNCDIIQVGNKTVRQMINSGELVAGDIVTYVSLQHTNIYAGNNKWYDAGHAYCTGSGEGAVFKSWYGDARFDNQKVGYIIRPRMSTQYIVQVGSYSKKTNAVSIMNKLKAAGFSAILKQENDQYKVQCGVFSVKENATNLVTKLHKAGFEAVIK